MRLTLMTDYALRLMMHAAQHPERLCTIAEVAAAHDISETHLMKVTHQLARLGWIETVRGRGGGLRLAHAPGAITVGAVVRGLEPDFCLVECFGPASRCGLTGQCRLTGVLAGALERFMTHLDGVTLAGLLDDTAVLTARSGRTPSLQPLAGPRIAPRATPRAAPLGEPRGEPVGESSDRSRSRARATRPARGSRR